MESVIAWLGIALICLLLFVVGMLAGIVRRSLNMVLLSVLMIVLAGGAGIVAVYQFAKTSYRAVHTTFRARTGNEVYTAVFGKPVENCVEVTDFFDPVVPVMDAELSLSFKTCPQEMKRLLTRRTYAATRASTLAEGTGGHQCCPSFNINEFGDSVLKFTVVQEDGSIALYMSMDSTRGYYIENW